MATIALDKAAGIETVAAPRAEARHATGPKAEIGLFRRLWDALVEAQEMRAAVYVHGYLAHLTDAELARHGMTRDQMIRTTRNLMTRM